MARNLQEIINSSYDLELKDSKVNKYNYYGYTFKQKNYKKFDLSSLYNLIQKNNEYEKTRFASFIDKYKETTLIINYIEDYPIGLFFKPFYKKDNYVIFNKQLFPYNIGNLNKNRKYTDPILICEGIADCEYLKTIYSDTVAILGANISTFNFNILKRLTNKIILCNDNDKAGLESLEKIKKNVKFSHMYFSNLKNPNELKDAGDMIDLLRTNNKICYNINDNYYRLSFSNI